MTAQPTPTFAGLVKTFARIGCLSFGGPAGQIALMHRAVVEERGWVTDAQYLHALNFCHFLPGPEAQQLATWIGWKLHGWRGGLAALSCSAAMPMACRSGPALIGARPCSA